MKRIHEIIHQSDQNSDNLDDLANVTLPTIYLPNELSNLSQQIPNLSIEGDERGEASTSRSSPRPDEIQEQEEDHQDDSLAFLLRNRLRRDTNKQVPASVNNFEQDSFVELTEEEATTDDSQSEDESTNDDNETSEEFEDYSTPHYESNPFTSESTNNNQFLWILL